jgi:hypothetical protein
MSSVTMAPTLARREIPTSRASSGTFTKPSPGEDCGFYGLRRKRKDGRVEGPSIPPFFHPSIPPFLDHVRIDDQRLDLDRNIGIERLVADAAIVPDRSSGCGIDAFGLGWGP